MRHSPAAALLALAAFPIVLASCSDITAPPAARPVADIAPPSARWSDPGTWPGGVVPAAGAAVVIPKGQGVLLDVSPPALRSLTVEGDLVFEERDLALSANWIVVKGVLQVGTEAAPFAHRATITLTGTAADPAVGGLGTKLLGVYAGGTLDLHGARRTSWLRLGATAAKGASQLALEGDPGWVAGDHIAVASSDFDPLQGEEVVIKSATGGALTLEQPLKYRHWGVVQTVAGYALDERAEVGLLSRNIVVRGDAGSATTSFGGHVISLAGSTTRIEGVEFYLMGQKGLVARYPIHWHMAGDAAGQYARDNAIHRTFNRCLTIHGTHAVAAEGNVCYDHMGHGYFLEDGSETRNVIVRNLGFLTRTLPVGQGVLPSDAQAGTFWISNPNNTLRGNVAAGSQGFGIWYALPTNPTGLSTNASIFPRQTPLGEFTDNVAHSNSRTGLNVDNGPLPDGNTETASFSPRQIPGTNSAPVVAYFRNFTGYKHTGRAVWLRGSYQRLVNATLADNGIGATFAASETFMQGGVVIGESENMGALIAAGFPIRGFEFYDGRVGAQGVTFVNFTPSARRPASALGFNRNNGYPTNPGNFIEGLRLIESNGVYLENPNPGKDGDKSAVFVDTDGSVTGVSGAYVAENNPMLVTPACTYQTAWNAYVCRQRFLRLSITSAGDETEAPLDVVRDDGAKTSLVGVPNNPKAANVALIPGRGYELRFSGAAPRHQRVTLSNMVAGEWVNLTMQFPRPPHIVRDGDTARPLAAAGSAAEVWSLAGDRYFYDAGAGILYVKALARTGRTTTTLAVDPR